MHIDQSTSVYDKYISQVHAPALSFLQNHYPANKVVVALRSVDEPRGTLNDRRRHATVNTMQYQNHADVQQNGPNIYGNRTGVGQS